MMRRLFFRSSCTRSLSDPQDKDHWILDEEAAPVVKRIFDMTIAGGEVELTSAVSTE